MCGIVGAASSFLSSREVEVFEDLMIVSNLRGSQGAGVIIVCDNGNKVHSVKTGGTGIDVTHMKSYVDLVKSPQVLVGHTRLPTKGGTDISAVHPHTIKGQLAGVHNGTITRVDNKEVPVGASDSATLYASIAKNGAKGALKDATGAYALVWVDYKTGRLNFIRNSQRPMYFAKCNWGNHGRTLYWASEAGFLSLILGRANIKHEIEELPTNQLWSVSVRNIGEFTKEPDYVPFGYQVVRKEVEDGEHWSNSVPFSHSAADSEDLTDDSGVKMTVYPPGSRIQGSVPQIGHNNPPQPETNNGTFVIRDGVVVRKGHDSEKQVTLPRANDSTTDERQGSSSNGGDVAKAPAQNVVPIRGSDVAKIRDSSGRFVALGQQYNPQVRKEEESVAKEALATPEDDFQRQSKLAAEWREEVEDDFLSLLHKHGEETLKKQQQARSVADLFDPPNRDNDSSCFVETVKGHYVSRDYARRLAANGCCYCGDSHEFGPELNWLDQAEFLCDECSRDPEAMANMYVYHPHSKLMSDWREGKLKHLGDAPGHNNTYDSNDARMILQ